ncbi:hypothetical protein J6590_011401 [Homalodisca vitripennis]|nr:hypothetical protein J6590_011401 [Homalodisca vitripennis]
MGISYQELTRSRWEGLRESYGSVEQRRWIYSTPLMNIGARQNTLGRELGVLGEVDSYPYPSQMNNLNANFLSGEPLTKLHVSTEIAGADNGGLRYRSNESEVERFMN